MILILLRDFLSLVWEFFPYKHAYLTAYSVRR